MRLHCIPLLASIALASACRIADATWVAHGPDGGIPSAVDAQGGVLRIATVDGVYQSVDAGGTWQRLGDLPRGALAWDVATQPGNPDVVLARTDQTYRSTDGGAHWVATGAAVGRMVFHPLAPDQVLMAGNGVLRRSDDAGATWQDVALPATEVAADPTLAGAYYAATLNGGVHYSINGGVSWTLLRTETPAPAGSLAPDPFEGDVVLWLLHFLDGGAVRRLERSSGTATWVMSSDDENRLVADPVVAGRFWFDGLSFALSSDPTLFESVDHGVTFTPVGPLPGHLLGADPGLSGRLYGSDALGFAISDDAGRSWHSRTQGVPLAQTNEVSIHPLVPGEVLAAGDGYGVALSSNAGGSWQASNGGLTRSRVFTVARSPHDPQLVYAGTDDGLFRSSDGGRNWNEVPIASYPNTPHRFYRLAFDATDPDLLVAMLNWYGPIAWSDNGGVDWRTATVSDGAFDLRALPHANVGTRHVYVLNWRSGNVARLYRADAHGGTFSPTVDDLLVSAVAVQPNDDLTLVALAFAGAQQWNAYLSHDGGDHWQQRGTVTMPSNVLPQLVFDACDARAVHAVTGASLYTSDDLGATWRSEQLAIPAYTTNALDARCVAGERVLAAATEQAGAQVRASEAVDVIHDDGFDAGS